MTAGRGYEKPCETSGGTPADSADDANGLDHEGGSIPNFEPADPAKPPRKLRLDQYLKLVGLAPTGGQAKLLVQAGEVRVNGEIETRRGRGLRPGDRIEAVGGTWVVTAELWDDLRSPHE